MKALRPGSPRPELVVDNRGRPVGENHAASVVGRDAPWGRERVVFALPLNTLDLVGMKLLRDHASAQIADPDGVIIGVDRVWISRLLSAAPTVDTRRLR